MKKNFLELVKSELKSENTQNGYYKLTDVKKVIRDNSHNDLKVEEVYITPFYIDNGTYEIYHLALSIKIVEKPNREKHFLKRADVKSVEQINKAFLLQLNNTYFEVKKNDNQQYFQIIRDYIDYIYSNREISRLVKEVFGSYSKSNLYFEIL